MKSIFATLLLFATVSATFVTIKVAPESSKKHAMRAAVRRLQSGADFAALKQMCNYQSSLEAILAQYLQADSTPTGSPLTVDVGSMVDCICSESFTVEMLMSMQGDDEDARAAAMQVMCSSDCREFLEFTYASIGSAMQDVGGEGLNSILTNMVDCMCDIPVLASLLSASDSSSTTTSNETLQSMCCTDSCTAIVEQVSLDGSCDSFTCSDESDESEGSSDGAVIGIVVGVVVVFLLLLLILFFVYKKKTAVLKLKGAAEPDKPTTSTAEPAESSAIV